MPAQQELFRNDDKIDLEIRTGSTEGIMVIPVSVQVLVENALKHNACSKNWPEHDEILVSRERVAGFKKWMDR